ncbi:peptidoglycan-binding protein [Streptomyces sp. NPDC088246]|uniref:peptidoglycan-binding domain-containing protein n=1 Tax=Streptomyces sp. NPDC088246 TaxID=3365842 RepID=UPI0038249DC9
MKKTMDTPAQEEFTAVCGRVWDALIPARASYLANVSQHYDEVFYEAAQRAERVGSIGKTHIAEADGVFGPATNAAVRSFHTPGRLEADVLIGPRTWGRPGRGPVGGVRPHRP